MNIWNHSKNDNQDETESENLNIDIKSRIAALQSNSANSTSSSTCAPQYAAYQPSKSPVLIRPTASTKPSTSSFNPKPKIRTSPIQRQNSLPRDRDSNHSPSSASTSNSRNSNSNDFISEFGTIKGGSDVKASTFGGRSNAWNLGDGDNASSSSFHLTTQDDKQSKLRKSGSGLSLRELAVQSDAERRSRSNSTESRHFNQTSSPSRRGGGASSPAPSGSGSPRLGVKNIIALYGGNNSGAVLPGSLGRSSSPSSNTTSSINRNRLGLGTSIPDASSSSDSVHIVKKRPPRHMLDASDDGSTSLQLHPTLCPSPTISNQSPVRSGASSPAGDLFTSRQAIPRSPQLSVKPPAPPRPPKPTTSTTASSTNTPPKLPSRFTVQPPTPSRNYKVDSAPATRRSSHSPTRVERATGGSNTNGPFTAPLLPPRKVGSGSISAGVSPSSTGDGHSFNYQAYTSRNNSLKDQSSNSSGPALPPRSNTNRLSKEQSNPPRRSSADSASTSSKPPPPLPRRSMGTSSSAASDLSISSSNGSSTSINLIPPPPPRHKVQSSSNQSHHHHSKSSISNLSSVSLTDDASAELKHSLESEIGDRSSLTGKNGLNSTSRGGPPLTPSNPLLPPPRAVRSLAQGAPSRTGGLGLAGNNSNFRFGSGSSQSSSPNRGRTLTRKNRKSAKRSYTPDPTSRARYENLFQRLLVPESIRKKKKKSEKRMEIDSGGSRSGISIPSSRRDLNRTITSNDDDEESSGVQALKNRFDSNTASSGNNGFATSAPSERENSNPFLSTSSPSTSNLLQFHRYTSSAGPGLETSTSSNPFIPIKRVEKLFKCSKLSNNFLSEIFSEIVKYQDGNQVKGLEKEAFIRGLTAIDHELARRQIRQRRKDRIGNGGDENGVSRNKTIKGYQRPTPKPPNNSASSNVNWADATRLPKRVAPPPKPL